MSYRPFKQRKAKISAVKLTDFDLFFDEVPPQKAYKFRRAANRKLRKLKLA